MRAARVEHEFVEFIPDVLEPGRLYISMEYATSMHLCLCGCQERVVTPLAPTDWRLTYDGESVSLNPSIGNWSFDCQSHYWIERSQVRWAGRWSRRMIDAVRDKDQHAKAVFYGNATTRPGREQVHEPARGRRLQGLLNRLRRG